MNIGFIGLSKLGLPCAVAIAEKGHRIYGYDVNTEIMKRYSHGTTNLYEPDIDKQLQGVMSRVNFASSLDEVVFNSEIVFVAVQTPHPPELDGSIRHHHVRKDFNYDYLVKAVQQVAKALNQVSEYKVIAIISTVLPGTTTNIIYPAMTEITQNNNWGLCYNPSFIAMGQVIKDYYNPEFTLIGEDSPSPAGEILARFYGTIHTAPKLRMTWEEAEMVKVTYNTFIGVKLAVSNMIMEMCHKIGADCDVVLGALQQAKQRITSPAYMRGGAGDGGPCHPRDNLALSYHSDRLGLSYNLFDYVMEVREKQTEWLADLMCEHNLPKVILGRTYKPNTNLIDGSCSVLLANILKERGEEVTFYDPQTDPELPPRRPSVYLIGTMWPEFKEFPFEKDSVILDPWGFIENVPEGVKLISVGRRAANV